MRPSGGRNVDGREGPHETILIPLQLGALTLRPGTSTAPILRARIVPSGEFDPESPFVGFVPKGGSDCRFSEGWDPRFSKPFPPELFPRLNALVSVSYSRPRV